MIAARLKEELESAGEEVQLYGFRPGGDVATEYSLDSWVVMRVEETLTTTRNVPPHDTGSNHILKVEHWVVQSRN